MACGLPSQFYFRQIGLNRLSGQGLVPIKYGIPSDHKDYIVGSGYTLFKSRIKKSPTVRVTVREYNDDGWYIGNREIVYEDYPMISFLPGHILDVIINMHVYTKPHLYHRVYAEAVLPEWKLGILTEDFTMKASRAVAYLWAQSFVVSYEDPRWPKVHSIPQLKILNIKDRHHPEQLNIFNESNCIIPVMKNMEDVEEISFKAGDYFYFIEI